MRQSKVSLLEHWNFVSLRYAIFTNATNSKPKLNGIHCVYFSIWNKNFALFAYRPMTYVEFNLIGVISACIITATISTAYCSFAYLLRNTSLYEVSNNQDQNISQEVEHTDTVLMAGKPFYYRQCYHKERLKLISIYNPTVPTVIRLHNSLTFSNWRNNHKIN